MDRFDCHDPDIGYLSRQFTGGLAMSLSVFRGGLAAFVLAAIAAMPAFADIKAFNAAVRAGDYKTAAAEAKSTWATFDKSSPDAAIVAREFGFASLVAGDNEQARQFAAFLMDKGPALSQPDDQPMTSAVLFRVADFKIRKGDRERAALRDALTARAGAPGVDMTSALAWEVLYIADWNSADWPNSIADADAAAAFLARENGLLVYQRKAEVHSAASTFVGSRGRITQGRNDLYDRIADVHDRIVRDIDAAGGQASRSQLWPLKWKAEAWAIAVESFINSSYEQVGSNISTRLQPRPLSSPRFGQLPEEASSLPGCSGSFEGPKLFYPQSKSHEGVGALIARLETGADGKVVDVEVLAAIPDESFVSNMIKTMKAWTFKPAAGTAPGSCRLNSRNRYFKVSFRLL
jgi:hypothetical protein